MYQCSFCTAGSGFTSVKPEQKCVTCNLVYVHICSRCNLENPTPSTCYLCTERPHICLSKCNSGCILRKRPECMCKNGPIRLQVKKNNKNHGRYFWA